MGSLIWLPQHHEQPQEDKGSYTNKESITFPSTLLQQNTISVRKEEDNSQEREGEGQEKILQPLSKQGELPAGTQALTEVRAWTLHRPGRGKSSN